MRNERKRRILNEEIILYDKVKTEWGLGHVECGIRLCGIQCCPYIVRGIWVPCRRYHQVVLGHYVDDENRKRKAFLGYN